MLVRRWSAHQTPAYDRLSAAKDIPGRWKVYKDVSWLAAECSPGPRGLQGALEARHHPGGCCNGIAESPAGSRLAVPSLSKCARGHPVPVYHFSEYFPSTSFDIYNKIPETQSKSWLACRYNCFPLTAAQTSPEVQCVCFKGKKIVYINTFLCCDLARITSGSVK